MDPDRVVLVLCLVTLIVVGVNGVLLVSFLRGRRVGEIELLRKAAKTARNPLRGEQADLEELARRVAEIKGGPTDTKPAENSTTQDSDHV